MVVAVDVIRYASLVGHAPSFFLSSAFFICKGYLPDWDITSSI